MDQSHQEVAQDSLKIQLNQNNLLLNSNKFKKKVPRSNTSSQISQFGEMEEQSPVSNPQLNIKYNSHYATISAKLAKGFQQFNPMQEHSPFKVYTPVVRPNQQLQQIESFDFNDGLHADSIETPSNFINTNMEIVKFKEQLSDGTLNRIYKLQKLLTDFQAKKDINQQEQDPRHNLRKSFGDHYNNYLRQSQKMEEETNWVKDYQVKFVQYVDNLRFIRKAPIMEAPVQGNHNFQIWTQKRKTKLAIQHEKHISLHQIVQPSVYSENICKSDNQIQCFLLGYSLFDRDCILSDSNQKVKFWDLSKQQVSSEIEFNNPFAQPTLLYQNINQIYVCDSKNNIGIIDHRMEDQRSFCQLTNSHVKSIEIKDVNMLLNHQNGITQYDLRYLDSPLYDQEINNLGQAIFHPDNSRLIAFFHHNDRHLNILSLESKQLEFIKELSQNISQIIAAEKTNEIIALTNDNETFNLIICKQPMRPNNINKLKHIDCIQFQANSNQKIGISNDNSQLFSVGVDSFKTWAYYNSQEQNLLQKKMEQHMPY